MPTATADREPSTAVRASSGSIDPEHDPLETVRDITYRRSGKRINPCTAYRWIHKGVRGVRLEAVLLAGTWYTTSRAFAEFMLAQTRVRLGDDAPAFDDAPAPRSAEKVKELRRAGLLK